MGSNGTPQYPIRYHPAIGQVDILMELNGNFFMTFFYNHTFQPISHAIVLMIMVAENLNMIADLVILIIFGRFGKRNCCQNCLQIKRLTK